MTWPPDPFSLIQGLLIPVVGWLSTIASRLLNELRGVNRRLDIMETWRTEHEKAFTDHVREKQAWLESLRDEVRTVARELREDVRDMKRGLVHDRDKD